METGKNNEIEIEESDLSVLAWKKHIICFGQRANGFCSVSVTLLLHASWATQHQQHPVCFHLGHTYAAHMHCAKCGAGMMMSWLHIAICGFVSVTLVKSTAILASLHVNL